jgi:glycosyltransferase involved in cell wall biosynthesis
MLNEEENVAELVRQTRDALEGFATWELIIVDDGSQDRTAGIVMEISRKDPRVRLLRLARRYGQSTAMQAGFDHVRGDVVVTMDGDLQNDPGDILTLVDKLHEGYDLVVGYRVRRKDRLIRRKIPSWVANRIIRWITGVPVRDNGCSQKAYRRDLITKVRLYSDMHRFIPAISAGIAGARITEVPVNHRPRTAGESKYGISRVLKVLADLITVKMIRSFRDRPLRLFSIFALWSSLFGVAFTVATLLAHEGFQLRKAEAMVFPGAALVFFALATFLLLLGLVGESVIRRNLWEKDSPLVKEVN